MLIFSNSVTVSSQKNIRKCVFVSTAFDGRVVVITGAASGIGKEIALEFAQQGAKVSIGDIDDEAEKTVQEIEDMGAEALFTKTDVSAAEDVNHLIDVTVEKFGRLDHAFNNAGMLNDVNRLDDVPVEEFNQVIDSDMKGVCLAMEYELNYMEENGGGTMVNTASVAGLIADPKMPLYVAAKHGVVGLTKSTGFDYAEKNI